MNIQRIFFLVLFLSQADGQCSGITHRTADNDAYQNIHIREYSPNLQCEWLIYGPGGRVIVDIFNVDLECDYDDLKVYNGSNRWASLVATLCNETSGRLFISTGNHLYITFNTDANNIGTYSGFKLNFYSASPQTLSASRENGFITSSGYPNRFYQRSSQELWLIHGVNNIYVEVVDMKLETSSGCVYDVLELFTGLSSASYRRIYSLCGTVSSHQYNSFHTDFLVRFKTDTSGEARGFKLRYFSQAASQTLYALDTTATLTSPGHPYSYFNNMHIIWRITSDPDWRITLQVTSFDMESDYDTLKIYEGASTSGTLVKQVTGSFTQAITSSWSGFLLEFVTDGSNVGAGFVLWYRRCCHQRLISTSTTTATMLFNSYGYPSNYPSNFHQYRTIQAPVRKAIELQWIDIDIEGGSYCKYDVLNIYDGSNADAPLVQSVCGHSAVALTSSGNALFLRFESDDSISGGGFSLSYSYVDRSSKIVLWAKEEEQTISTIHNMWKQLRRWTIKRQDTGTIKVMVTSTFRNYHRPGILEQVIIYDGQAPEAPRLGTLNSSTSSTYISTGNEVDLVYWSDNSTSELGIEIKFAKITENIYTSHKHIGLNEVIGISLGASFISVTVVIAVACFTVRNKKKRSRSRRRPRNRRNLEEVQISTVSPTEPVNTTHVNPVFEEDPPPRYTIVMRDAHRYGLPEHFRDCPSQQRY